MATVTEKGVINEIILICNYLTTRTTYKKHGGYNIYEDDMILAKLDTFVSNTELSVKVGESHVAVFSANYCGDVYKYNPGAWELYLRKLADKARLAKEDKLLKDMEIREEYKRKNFGPVSDKVNDVFNDLT